jgi:drug/metabolite transporter (DMT)-like permease
MQSLWMLAASLLFASMGVCVKLASEHGFSAAEIVFYRSAISVFLMLPVLWWKGTSLATPHWRAHVNRSVSGFVALTLYFWSITLLPLATAVTLNYTAPIFLAVLLVFVSQERLKPMMGVALVMGLIGVVVLLHPTFQSDQLLGGMIGLSSGVLAAVAYFNVRELGAKGESEARIVFYFSTISTFCSLGWLWFSEIHALTFLSIYLLLGVAGFATLAQLAMTRAYKRGKTMLSASLAYTTVIFSSLYGMLFWNEHLGLDAWVAIGMIVLSGILAGRR